MTTIYKYPVAPGAFILRIPKGARFLAAQVQQENPQMWFLLDPEADNESRFFVLAGTGERVPDSDKLTHLSTFQMNGGALVFHLFEFKDK